MTVIKARKCFVPRSPSDWVAKVFLTCDNILAVQFNRGQKVEKVLPHGPGAYLGHGGAPSVCCLYPGTQGELAERLYDLAQVWAYGGEWVHAFLYKKFGYRRVAAPTSCGGCTTTCSISTNPASPTVGQTVTITCTVTNNDGSPTKGDAPKGTATFYVDGTSIGVVTLPDNEPDTQNYETVGIQWTATCTPQATHTIEAIYTPADADFAGTSCSTSVTVSGCGGVSTTCCPNSLPTTLYATLSGQACCAGTYPLTYPGYGAAWNYNGTSPTCGGSNLNITFYCENNLWYAGAGCPNLGAFPAATSSDCSTMQFAFTQSNSTCGPINIAVTS